MPWSEMIATVAIAAGMVLGFEGHGWTHAEAAELLSLPLGTLKSTVARAKQKCRAMWEGADHG